MVSAFTLGISHPAGFPTYNLLAKALTFLPVGSVAFKVNLFSALLACLTLGCLYLTAYKLLAILFPQHEAGKFVWPAALPAALLAFSYPFWQFSLVAEVYTLHAFFTSLIVLLLLTWRQRGDVRYLFSAALVYGLSAGNHATVAFFLPGLLILFFLWNREQILRRLGMCTLFFAVGLSVYAYLPIRSQAEPSMDWGNPETVQGFFYQVTDRKDADTHFAFLRQAGESPGTSPEPQSVVTTMQSALAKTGKVAGNLLTDLSRYLTPVAAAGLLLGAWMCARRNLPLFLFFLWVLGSNAAFFVHWQRESYFPSYLVACLLTSAALYGLLFKPREQKINLLPKKGKVMAHPGSGLAAIDWRRVGLGILVALVPWLAFINAPRVDRSQLYFGETLLQRVFLSLPDRSLFVPGMSWFNFFYSQDVKRLRDDVTGVKAWDLLGPNPTSMLTPERYPDLNLPAPTRHRFDTASGTLDYVRELFERNRAERPVVVEQNLIFFEQVPLVSRFQTDRNLLVRYHPSDPGSSGNGTGLDPAFAEFQGFLESELKKPGIMLDRVWITKIAYYVPSFARFYHDKKRYAEERAALRVMYEFLGQRGPDWHFQWIDNLVLDGKLEQARSALAALQRDFPAHYKARLAEGLLLRAEGNREGALDAMIEAVQIRPDAFRPRLELAATYRAAGEPDHFKEELTQARKNAGTLRDLHLLQNRFPRDLQAVARQVF